MQGVCGSPLRACQPLLRHLAAPQARAPGFVTAQQAYRASRSLVAAAMQFKQAEGQQSGLGAGGSGGVSGPDATPPPPAMDFERAASFDDLLQANIRYLRGELKDTPYWCAAMTRLSRAPTAPTRPPTAHACLTPALPPSLPTNRPTCAQLRADRPGDRAAAAPAGAPARAGPGIHI